MPETKTVLHAVYSRSVPCGVHCYTKLGLRDSIFTGQSQRVELSVIRRVGLKLVPSASVSPHTRDTSFVSGSGEVLG